MAPAKIDKKSAQVSATISKELFDALEDHRWTARLNMSDLVRVALEQYAVANNLVVAPPEA